MGKLLKFLRLSWAEKWLLMFAIAGLMLVPGVLRIAGFQRTWTWLQRRLENRRASAKPLAVQDIVRLLTAACGLFPWTPNCLQRSLVLWYLCHRNGFPAELQIGVTKELQYLKAHAWVELAGKVLNDRADVASRYVPFVGTSQALQSLLARRL